MLAASVPRHGPMPVRAGQVIIQRLKPEIFAFAADSGVDRGRPPEERPKPGVPASADLDRSVAYADGSSSRFVLSPSFPVFCTPALSSMVSRRLVSGVRFG